MAQKKPVLIDLDISHLCWCVDVTDKMKDTVLKTISPAYVDKNNLINIYYITSPDLKHAMELIKKHPFVKKVDVLRKGEDRIIAKIASKYDAMVTQDLHSSDVVPVEPIVVEGGLDKLALLAPSEKQLRELMGKLDERGVDLKLKAKKYLTKKDELSLDFFRTSGFLNLHVAAGLLTQKQREIFELACRYGYYDIPKKITLEELAQKTGIHVTTLNEHLRKAEAKLFPIFAEVLKKL
ncbi:MAG: helix-turn-helix domain-containing protein [Candidatus Micrarchaeota archaeon]